MLIINNIEDGVNYFLQGVDSPVMVILSCLLVRSMKGLSVVDVVNKVCRKAQETSCNYFDSGW